MIFLRSLLFVVLFYLWSGGLGILVLPALLGPRRWTMGVFLCSCEYARVRRDRSSAAVRP